MNKGDIVIFAAPLIYAGAVALTTWLSYRRIMKKYPAKPKQAKTYPPS
jgi:hypothetical protein